MNPLGYLLLDRIKIKGANAISSPITYGFPALTGFMGLMHALNRKIYKHENAYVHFDGILIACHDYDLHARRENKFSDYKFTQQRAPVNLKGEAPSIIQEGKIDLTVSLVIEMKSEKNDLDFINAVELHLKRQRIAGGDVLDVKNITYICPTSDINHLKKYLHDSFILIEDKHHFISLQEIMDISPLDVLSEICKTHYISKNNKWEKHTVGKKENFTIPITVGYQAISELFEKNKMENMRDNTFSSQYVENIYSLGTWIFSKELADHIDSFFWRYRIKDNLYLITQEI